MDEIRAGINEIKKGCIVVEVSFFGDISAISKVLDCCKKSVELEKDNVELWGIDVYSPCLRCGVIFWFTSMYFFGYLLFFQAGKEILLTDSLYLFITILYIGLIGRHWRLIAYFLCVDIF